MSDLILESYTDGCIRKLEDVINDLETALTYSSDDSYTKRKRGYFPLRAYTMKCYRLYFSTQAFPYYFRQDIVYQACFQNTSY